MTYGTYSGILRMIFSNTEKKVVSAYLNILNIISNVAEMRAKPEKMNNDFLLASWDWTRPAGLN